MASASSTLVGPPGRGYVTLVALAAAGLLVLAAGVLGRDAAGKVVVVPSLRIDLARATPQDVELLPGVGPTLAARLYAAGRAGTPREIGDLSGVSRMGPGARARVEPWLLFSADGATSRGDALYAETHE